MYNDKPHTIEAFDDVETVEAVEVEEVTGEAPRLVLKFRLRGNREYQAVPGLPMRVHMTNGVNHQYVDVTKHVVDGVDDAVQAMAALDTRKSKKAATDPLLPVEEAK